MTSQELKEVLKSQSNLLAGAAIQLIEDGGPLQDLAKLVEQGCAHTYVSRDPSHPRSRFLTKHVLDKCFDTRFGVVKQTQREESTLTVLGVIHDSEGREAYFKLLLDAGFTQGNNGYRGMLFPSILHECFYPDHMSSPERRETAKRFARILLDSGRFDIQQYACNSYDWIGNLTKLDTVLAFGASPAGPGMIDEALAYIACAPNDAETHQTRADVIRRLIELGATPQKTLRKRNDARFQIESWGILHILSSFGVIDADQPPEYLEYLERTGQANPRLTPAAA